MITDDDKVKLIDFGLARATKKTELLQSNSGSPAYMAPE